MSNRNYSNDEINFLKENIDKFGAEVCATKLGRAERSVISVCYRKIGHCKFVCNASTEEVTNLEFKGKFCPLTVSFLETTHPKELAYFLGYFWADGYIRSDGCLVMEITKEDADDIEHILMSLVKFITYERIRPNRKTQKTFFYKDYNDNVTSVLKTLGKYSKSLESHKRIIEFIPKEYINYFLRGLFDGDGCLYISKENSKQHCTQLTISGRYGQDWNYLIEFIENKYGLKFKPILREYKEYKCSFIRATDKTEIANFLGEIYKENDGIYLSRKYKKVRNLIEE